MHQRTTPSNEDAALRDALDELAKSRAAKIIGLTIEEALQAFVCPDDRPTIVESPSATMLATMALIDLVDSIGDRPSSLPPPAMIWTGDAR